MIYYTWSVRWCRRSSSPPSGIREFLLRGVLCSGIEPWSSRYKPKQCLDLLDSLHAQGNGEVSP